MSKILKTLAQLNPWKKPEKVDPPDAYAIVKINDVAKESGVYDDENKIIELHRYGKIDRIKYSEPDIDEIRNQGIPVIDEDYTDEYEFLNVDSGGEIEYKK